MMCQASTERIVYTEAKVQEYSLFVRTVYRLGDVDGHQMTQF